VTVRVIAHSADIGGIVDQHCLNCLYVHQASLCTTALQQDEQNLNSCTNNRWQYNLPEWMQSHSASTDTGGTNYHKYCQWLPKTSRHVKGIFNAGC